MWNLLLQDVFRFTRFLATFYWLMIFTRSGLVNGAPTSSYEPRPYTVAVDESLIEEARIKASTFRSSDAGNTPAWFDGPPPSDIAPVAHYWASEYDWSQTQAEINANFSHFYTTVPPPSANYPHATDLHFIHQRSTRKDAIPILLLHGWPSTSLEWANVIPSLVDPESSTDPAFHVVAPDLPGYGFSPDFTGSRANITAYEYATIFVDLMSQLHYDRFLLYSTDLGYLVSLSLVVDYSERVINHITDFYLVFPTTEDQNRFAANLTTPEESAYLRPINVFLNGHSGYSAIHSTLPLSLAYALNDSPIGFLAWYYQLAEVLTDRPYSLRDLVTNTLLLWLPGVYGNIRSYKELFSPAAFTPKKKYTVPTSVLQFGGVLHYPDLQGVTYVPLEWVERTANVTYFSRCASGGHFPATTVPDVVVGHIRNVATGQTGTQPCSA